MLAAVIPAQNEQGRVGRVIRTLAKLPLDRIIVVVNGSRDRTWQEATGTGLPQVTALYFDEALGIDVPRAVGTKHALDAGAHGVLFVDGDMVGLAPGNLAELLAALDRCDAAFTNCYPGEGQRLTFASEVLLFRQRLNRELKVESTLGLASPSHGPHAYSRRLLERIPLRELAIPPVVLPLAKRLGLVMTIGTTIPHLQMCSSIRHLGHSQAVADTMIGDCLEALCVWQQQERQRRFGEKNYIGYHLARRWDILQAVLAGRWPDVTTGPSQGT